MKKLFLLSVVGALGALSASAQLSGASVVRVDAKHNLTEASKSSSVSGSEILSRDYINGTSTTTPLGKTTASGFRSYNFVNYLAKIDATILTDKPIGSSTTSRYGYTVMWNGFKAIGDFGTSFDTISLGSYGAIFDPTFPTFNDIGAYAGTDIAVTKTDAYKLDSVKIWGLYFRAPTKTAVVDTLRLAVVYGRENAVNNLQSKNYYMPSSDSRYGTNAVKGGNITQAYFPALRHDSVANRATGLSGRPPVQLYDILLTETASNNDTDVIDGLTWNKFTKAIGLNIPANNMVGISATFISGDASFVPYDTIDVMGATPKYNHFLPLIFEENLDGYPTFYGYNHYADSNEAHYNVGYLKPYPDGNTWETNYIPAYAYPNTFGLELPYIDYVISCTSCKTISGVSIKENQIITDSKAFPNPANTQLNVPVSVSETATVTVSITNLLGQVVATQNLGSMNAGQKETAVFNTTSLSAGVYLYTVEANGQRVSNRFSVSH